MYSIFITTCMYFWYSERELPMNINWYLWDRITAKLPIIGTCDYAIYTAISTYETRSEYRDNRRERQ